MRRYRRDHTPDEAVTEDNYQEEQEEEQEYEYQEEDQEDKEESYVVEASLPDVLPVSWQQPVLLPDLLDHQGSDTTDGEGSKENNAGSTGHGRKREERSGVEGEERVEDGRGEESRWRSEGRHLKRISGMDQVIE